MTKDESFYKNKHMIRSYRRQNRELLQIERQQRQPSSEEKRLPWRLKQTRISQDITTEKQRRQRERQLLAQQIQKRERYLTDESNEWHILSTNVTGPTNREDIWRYDVVNGKLQLID